MIGGRVWQWGIGVARQIWGARIVGLLIVDTLFLILHVGRVRYSQPSSDLWLISYDRGYAEIFQYLKLATVIVLLVQLALARRVAVYVGWSVLFLYFLLDDSVEIHETAGEWLSNAIGLASVGSVSARDIGQVLVSGIALVILGGAIYLMWPPSGSREERFSIGLGVLVALLGFFGVVVDVIDAIDLFNVVEDGGEMAAMSLIVAYVWSSVWEVRGGPEVLVGSGRSEKDHG